MDRINRNKFKWRRYGKINYNIDYSGDPTFGTVTFEKGVPTFIAE